METMQTRISESCSAPSADHKRKKQVLSLRKDSDMLESAGDDAGMREVWEASRC